MTRSWLYSKQDMQKLREEGRIDQTTHGADPYFRQYLDEIVGFPVGSVWDDLEPLHGHGAARLEYPSKEPLELLESILKIALQVNDSDPHECVHRGTALVASLNSARQWIGIGHLTNLAAPQGMLTPVGGSVAAA
jgi:hypothetical protein